MEAPGFEEHRTGRNAWAMRVSDAELQAFSGEPDHRRRRAPVRPDDVQHLGRVLADGARGRRGDGRARSPRCRSTSSRRRCRESDWANTTVLRGDLGDGGPPAQGAARRRAARLRQRRPRRPACSSSTSSTSCGSCSSRSSSGAASGCSATRPTCATCACSRPRTTSSGVVILTYDRAGERAGSRRRGARRTPGPTEQVDRSAPREDTDRVLATVLFTDIVDSTGRAAALGDREWRRTARPARRGVARRGQALGRAAREVDRRRDPRPLRVADPGAFAAPSRCARAARRLGIEIRAAVHTGEVEVRGDDIGGIGVHIASRVAVAGRRRRRSW